MCLVLLATLMVVPLVIGEYYDEDFARSLSPIAHFAQWYRMGAEVPILSGGARYTSQRALAWPPLLLAYGALLVYAWASLRRLMRKHTRVIQHKLLRMGVEGFSHPRAAMAVANSATLPDG